MGKLKATQCFEQNGLVHTKVARFSIASLDRHGTHTEASS
jgi:hypothetical protein